LARKQVRKNYFKNSLSRRKQRFIGRCLLGLKIVLLVGGLTGTSLLLILAYDTVTQSSYFEAKMITVEGTRELSKGKVLELAGLKLGDNILSVNVHTLRDRLMANPWIAAADIERTLPDAIHIQIRERVPMAIVDLERLFYLDENGAIFKLAESSDKARVPIVTGLSLSAFDLSDPWRSPLFGAVMDVLRLSRGHDSVIPFESLHRVHVDRDMGLTLFATLEPYSPPALPICMPALASTAGGGGPAGPNPAAIKVGFGSYESKFSRLRDIVSYLKRDSGFLNLQFVDLDDTDRIVVKPSVGGQPGSPSVADGCGLGSSRRKEV
jgi:cell division protein FtsQ